MNIPEKLINTLLVPATNGAALICSARAVMFYLGDHLADDNCDLIIPFQSIDSQTDHIELSSDYAFRLPSTRVGLDSMQGNGRLISSSVNTLIRPGDSKFEDEMSEIFEVFSDLYAESVADLLNSNSDSRRQI